MIHTHLSEVDVESELTGVDGAAADAAAHQQHRIQYGLDPRQLASQRVTVHHQQVH